MAFRRSSSSSKDVKKVSFYVWFLGAKEAKGLRGDEFVLPVLHQLLQQERILEPSKVTLQVSNKGLKIVQNVPKKSSPGKFAPTSNGSGSSSSTSSSTNISNGGPNCKMEQIKHLIPHDSITCVVQEDDIVCCLLLIFNPITKCPVHVHGYRCDSIETAAALKESLQTLIDRPENQKKFAEIEKRLALKHQTMSPAPLHPIPVQVYPLGVSGHLHGHHVPLHPHPLHPMPPLHLGAVLHPTGGLLPPRILPSSSHRRSAGGSSSDGRSTRTEGSDDSLPGHSRSGRGVFPGTHYPALGHHQTHMNVSRHSSRPPAVASGDRKSSRNNSFVHNNNNNNEMVKNKSPLRYKHHSKSHQEKEYEMDFKEDYRVNEEDDEDLEDEILQQKQEQFESLAQELKVKLTSGSGPILLPPRDYDTISRRRGNLSGIEQRKSTNKQIVGVLAQIKAKRQEMKELSQIQSSSSDKSSSTKINNKSNMQSSHRSPEACKQQVLSSTTNRSDASSSAKSSGIGSDEALAVIHDSPSKNSSRREITSRATTTAVNSSSSKDNNKMLKKSSLLLQQDHRNFSNRSSEKLQTGDSDDEQQEDFNNEPQQPTSSLRSWKILSDELRERRDIPPPVIPSQIQRSMAAGGINSSSQDRVNGMKLKGATSSTSTPADKTSSSNGVKYENRDTPKYYFPDPSFISPESRNDNQHSLSPGDDFSHMQSSSDNNKIPDKHHPSNNSGNKQVRKKNPAPAVPLSALSSSLTSSSSSSSVQNIYLEAGLSPNTFSVAKKTCSASTTNTPEGGSRKQHQQQQQFSSSSKSNIYSHTTTGNISNACSKSYPSSSSSSSRHVILDTNLCKLKQ